MGGSFRIRRLYIITLVKEDNNIISARNCLIWLNKTLKADWDDIYRAITNKECYPKEDIDISQNHKVVTLVDKDYPERLKHAHKVPWCIFYEGSLELLNQDNIMFIGGTGKGNNNIYKLIKDLSSTNIVINDESSDIERKALEIVMKNKQPLILVLNQSIDNSDIDSKTFLYAVKHGLVITEIGFESKNDIDETMKTNTRIIGFLSNKALITSSSKEDTRICLLVDELLSRGADLFVLPEKFGKFSMNNELIQCGATLVNKREDIY